MALQKDRQAFIHARLLGGWRIIGRTPIRLFDPQKQPPALLKPGDIVKFEPVSEEDYRRIEELVRVGAYKLQFEEL
ncbi:MAG: carboxyltransferase domain-containing protein [Candidatus Bathyarchaeia archaeon]